MLQDKYFKEFSIVIEGETTTVTCRRCNEPLRFNNRAEMSTIEATMDAHFVEVHQVRIGREAAIGKTRYRVAWRSSLSSGHGEWSEDVGLIDEWVRAANGDSNLNNVYHWRESSDEVFLTDPLGAGPMPASEVGNLDEWEPRLADSIYASESAIRNSKIVIQPKADLAQPLCARCRCRRDTHDEFGCAEFLEPCTAQSAIRNPQSAIPEELIFEQAQPDGPVTVRSFPKRIRITPELLAEADPKFISTLVEIRASNGHAFYRITGSVSDRRVDRRASGGRLGEFTFTAELAMGPFTHGEFIDESCGGVVWDGRPYGGAN